MSTIQYRLKLLGLDAPSSLLDCGHASLSRTVKVKIQQQHNKPTKRQRISVSHQH